MPEGNVILIGGHGKVALLAAPKLAAAGYTVTSLIRNPDHAAEVVAAGADPLVLDIETASAAELAETFRGATAVVFSAGAGGGNPARTKAVDQDAAIRTMDAAQAAGVRRYVMVSYVRSQVDINTLDKDNSFYPYAEAKHHADQYLRSTDLEYTILGPGKLTLETSTGRIFVTDEEGARPTDAQGNPGSPDTARDNVAEVIFYVLTNHAAVRQTVNFFDGQTRIEEAI